ncbi:hypothetical protein HX109_04290 [Galbibacter sp. BG1]|uniref:hypothetical protein n=1 Tax=Galbibacter sp. BG1 TaxID=1170699 RepID=UPI0015B7ABB7|nr:hypothetical protein [Galbibacter sp. BG1]QLE00821.1 hypothetical protein HX109_04290 [Galbibacter sp. BG1]
MDLEIRKYKFIQKLDFINESLFDKLESIVNEEMGETERISLEQYNKEIDKAIVDIEKGEFYTQEEVRRIASKW